MKEEKETMVRKILSLLLLLCMLVPMTVACGDKESEETNDSISTMDVELRDDAPTPIMDDFGGFEFKVLTRKDSLSSDDITGDVSGGKMSNATYTRNAILKDRYNFVVVEYKDPNPSDLAKIAGAAGEYAYDMLSYRMASLPSLALEGYLLDLNYVDGINLEASYYDERTIESVSFAERVFFITGDMLYMDDLSITGMIFNTKIWAEEKCSDVFGKSIYELVADGEWTFEAMKKIAILGRRDLNGDSIYGKDDQWGCVYSNADIFSQSTALGNTVLKKDADDVFYLNDSEKQLTDLASVFEFFNSPSCIKDHTYMGGHVLFEYLQLYNVANVVAPGDVPYGIVPVPKADKDSEYYSYVSGHSSNVISICTTVPDVDKTANVIELISYESQNTNVPVFAEFLFGKIYGHEDDIAMVDILLETRTYENAYVWNVGKIYSDLQDLNDAGGDGISSKFSSSKTLINSTVKSYLNTLRKLDY